MSKFVNYIIFLTLLLFSFVSSANNVIKIGVGNFPPFFIENENSGIFIEIIDEIFKQLPEYQVEYLFMSNHRLLQEINNGRLIDVACNIFPSSEVNAYLSEPIFRFRDVAVSMKSAQLEVYGIADLQGKSIAAYQGAMELLGGDFKKMAKANPEYSEHSQPKDTTLLMLSGKKDIRVGDINIFWNDLNNKFYQKSGNLDRSNFTIHYLWPDVYSHMAFKDKSLKDAVNKVIKKLKLNGSIEKIYGKYKVH